MARLNIGPKNLLENKGPIETPVSSTATSPASVLTEFIQIVKEVPIYITQIEKEYIEVPVEKVVEVIKEVPVEVIKFVDKEIEVIKNVEVFVERFLTQEIKIIPKWCYIVMLVEFLIIVFK